jgi:ATP-dependent DNA helicase RecG
VTKIKVCDKMQLRVVNMDIIENNKNEFKVLLNEKFEKEVVSFLNSKDGGNIYIGVEDNGNVVGVLDVDKIQLEVKDRIKNNISPSTLGLFDVVIKEIDLKKIIHVVIASGTEKPYYLKKKGMSPEGCFIRIGSAVEPMTDGMIIDMFSTRTRNSLRSIISPTQKLSFSQLKIYYEESGFEIGNNFLNQLDLINDDGKYNYVAYLLSDNNNVSIKVAKYKGIDSYNLIENEECGHCCLIKAAKNVLSRLEVENRTFTQITPTSRKELKMIDPIALREAVINAIVHNDYTYENAAKFELFDDRLEISSSGGLPERFTKEDFLGGFSAPKNKELMRVFKDVGLVEQLGTGVRRILKSYTPDIYEFYPNFIRVRFKYRVNFLSLDGTSKSELSVHANVEIITKIQKTILELIAKDPYITQEEIAQRINVSKRTIIRHMNELVELKLLKRVGDNRTGYWELI